jgi:hypothetical protein
MEIVVRVFTVIPEGREGMGCRGFSRKLRKALDLFHSFVGVGSKVMSTQNI